MSRPPDPTAGIVVSGGVTSVETADLVAAAAVVTEAVLRVEAALAHGRRAHGLVSGILDPPPSSVAWAGGRAACHPSLDPGLPASWTPVPPEVAAARSALLEEIAACTDALLIAGRRLDGLVDRLRKAAGIYEESESGVEGFLSWVARVPGTGVVLAVGAGLVDVAVWAAAGQGVRWERFVRGSAAYHDEAVRDLSTFLARVNPVPDLEDRSAVGEAAGMLRGMTESYRRRFAPAVVTTELTGDALPAGFSKPVAHSAEDLLSGIDVVYGKGNGLPDSVVSVEKYVDEDEKATWVVTVPGTQLGSATTPFSMTSNFDLVQGDDADSTAHVLAAMRQAEIPEGEEVVLVGHSQGGMVAMAVAAAATGAGAGRAGGGPRYDVRHVLTAGAPVGGATLPTTVRGTHVEIEQEVISQLDGTDNPVGPDRVTVRADLDAAGAPETRAVVPHGVPFHVDVLGRAREVGQPGLADNLDAIERAVSGRRVEERYFRGALAPLAVAPP